MKQTQVFTFFLVFLFYFRVETLSIHSTSRLTSRLETAMQLLNKLFLRFKVNMYLDSKLNMSIKDVLNRDFMYLTEEGNMYDGKMYVIGKYYYEDYKYFSNFKESISDKLNEIEKFELLKFDSKTNELILLGNGSVKENKKQIKNINICDLSNLKFTFNFPDDIQSEDKSRDHLVKDYLELNSRCFVLFSKKTKKSHFLCGVKTEAKVIFLKLIFENSLKCESYLQLLSLDQTDKYSDYGVRSHKLEDFKYSNLMENRRIVYSENKVFFGERKVIINDRNSYELPPNEVIYLKSVQLSLTSFEILLSNLETKKISRVISLDNVLQKEIGDKDYVSYFYLKPYAFRFEDTCEIFSNCGSIIDYKLSKQYIFCFPEKIGEKWRRSKFYKFYEVGLAMYSLIKKIGEMTRKLNENRLLNPAIKRFVKENMGFRNETYYYNNSTLEKFEYRYKFRPPMINVTSFWNITELHYPKIQPQPKCLRDININKMLCSFMKDLKQKKGRELTEKDIEEIPLEQIKRLVDFEYLENAKKNNKPVRVSLSVDKIIKESGLLLN